MSKVVTGASVSLDGFIAGPEETGFEHLFFWYEAGDQAFPSALPSVRFSLGEADHRYLSAFVASIGVFVCGRRLFDLVDGWGGTHPLDRPVVVVTHSVPEAWIQAHPDARFTFVTEGIERAIEVAREIAGGRDIGVNAGTIASQCLELGLLDEISFDIVPVVLGGGTPFFQGLGHGPYPLDGPDIIEGERVTHLRYTVRRPG